MIALNKNLLKIFFDIFISGKSVIIKEIDRKLIKYLQLPIAVSSHQNHSFQNPQLSKQQGNLFKVYDKKNDKELVLATKLKLMLVDSIDNYDFTTINLSNLQEEIDIRFSATYRARKDRKKALLHIKDLLEDAHWIKITDRYMTEDSNWETNLKILQEILPHKNIDITISSQANNGITSDQKTKLNEICADWEIKGERFNHNIIHDRYIETDKIEVLLSSGLLYLKEQTKDFTYLVRVKS